MKLWNRLYSVGVGEQNKLEWVTKNFFDTWESLLIEWMQVSEWVRNEQGWVTRDLKGLKSYVNI